MAAGATEVFVTEVLIQTLAATALHPFRLVANQTVIAVMTEVATAARISAALAITSAHQLGKTAIATILMAAAE